MTERIKIEQLILGACLIENGYSKVADILVSKNFSSVNLEAGLCQDHKKIFSVFEKSYPTKPIDLFTVRYALKGEPGYDVYLAELSSSICSTSNIRFHALLLLEYNLREAFLNILNSCFHSVSSVTTKAALQEIIDEALDYNSDIFELISAAEIHLRNVGDEHIQKSIADFICKVDRKIYQVKKQASVDCLVNNLNNLNGVPEDSITRLVVTHLTDILKAVLSKGKINKALATQILTLKSE